MADNIKPEKKPICYPKDAGHHGTGVGTGQQAVADGEFQWPEVSSYCTIPLPTGIPKLLVSAIPPEQQLSNPETKAPFH